MIQTTVLKVQAATQREAEKVATQRAKSVGVQPFAAIVIRAGIGQFSVAVVWDSTPRTEAYERAIRSERD